MSEAGAADWEPDVAEEPEPDEEADPDEDGEPEEPVFVDPAPEPSALSIGARIIRSAAPTSPWGSACR